MPETGGRRYLYIAPLFWRDGKPQIGRTARAGASRALLTPRFLEPALARVRRRRGAAEEAGAAAPGVSVARPPAGGGRRRCGQRRRRPIIAAAGGCRSKLKRRPAEKWSPHTAQSADIPPAAPRSGRAQFRTERLLEDVGPVAENRELRVDRVARRQVEPADRLHALVIEVVAAILDRRRIAVRANCRRAARRSRISRTWRRGCTTISKCRGSAGERYCRCYSGSRSSH